MICCSEGFYLNGVDAPAIFSFRSLVIKGGSQKYELTAIMQCGVVGLIRKKIVSSQKLESIYEIKGHWDRDVTIKDTCNGKTTVIYRAKDVISALKTPIVKDAEARKAIERTSEATSYYSWPFSSSPSCHDSKAFAIRYYRRKDIKRDSTSLTSQNSEIKFRLQAMEQQALLRDGAAVPTAE
uniref:Uncharacterized protein n=1 Tax=Tanacetum cinerariifolium TaxID=118510 RepID=A0A6L2L5P0_TANCI|nr:hypothetical protein [Tanacetum cinerariifolium]